MKLAALAISAACLLTPLRAADEAELHEGNITVRYVVEAPPNLAPAGTTDPTRQVGLFLCSPEHDHTTGDEILPVRESLRRLGLTGQYVLLGIHPQEQKFGPADHEPISKLLAWAMRTYPINPRRIYAYGKGEGSKISGEFVGLHPDLVAAAIGYSWGFWNMPSELKDPLPHAPRMYWVLGLRDLATHITTVRDNYIRANAKGYSIIYREFEDLSSRTYHPPSNDDAVAWATRLRNEYLPLSPQEAKLIQMPPAIADGYYPTLATVGGAEAGAIVRQLLQSKNEAVRLAAANTCSRAIFDESVIAALGNTLKDPSAKIRQAALEAITMDANWRSPAAQQALIRLVEDPDARQEDRVSALDAIGYAVRFQIHGVQQDPILFRTLVTAAESKNEDLRYLASAILEPIRDRDFRGDLGRPEQKAPEGGWQAWLDDISAKQAGLMKDYEVCGWGMPHSTNPLPGNRAANEPVDQFCKGGAALVGYNMATGDPVHRDLALAFQQTKAAADQGYVPAQANLAMMLATGRGVEQNYNEARRLWTQAAGAGHAFAASHPSVVRGGGGGGTNRAPANRAAAAPPPAR